MKNKMLKNSQKKMKSSYHKKNLLVEMAEDMMDIVKNAKLYKKMTKK